MLEWKKGWTLQSGGYAQITIIFSPSNLQFSCIHRKIEMISVAIDKTLNKDKTEDWMKKVLWIISRVMKVRSRRTFSDHTYGG
ncbi:hypothetical protein CsatA_020823 [Cannabis sativa]